MALKFWVLPVVRGTAALKVLFCTKPLAPFLQNQPSQQDVVC